jgi:hypothetical protein
LLEGREKEGGAEMAAFPFLNSFVVFGSSQLFFYTQKNILIELLLQELCFSDFVSDP